MKRILSFILVLSMVIPVAIQPVFAAATEQSYNIEGYVCNHTPPAGFEFVRVSTGSATLDVIFTDIALGVASLFIPDSLSKYWTYTSLSLAATTLLDYLCADRVGMYDNEIYKHPLLGDFWYHKVYYDYDDDNIRVNVACETEREFIGNNVKPAPELS